MKPNPLLLLLAALALPHFSFAGEADQPVKFADLPAAVAQAIKAAVGDAKLAKLVLGDEDGTPAYEAVWQAQGHQHEIAVAKDGSVLGLEEIIALEEAPEAIRAAISKEADGRKVREVEKVLEKGKTSYEATIESAKGKVQVRFNAAGKVLERENPDAEKGEKAGGKGKGKKGGKKEKQD